MLKSFWKSKASPRNTLYFLLDTEQFGFHRHWAIWLPQTLGQKILNKVMSINPSVAWEKTKITLKAPSHYFAWWNFGENVFPELNHHVPYSKRAFWRAGNVWALLPSVPTAVKCQHVAPASEQQEKNNQEIISVRKMKQIAAVHNNIMLQNLIMR